MQGGTWSGEPATRTVVVRRRRRRELKEAAFVLRAVGIEHALLTTLDGAQLVVRAGDALRASAELAAYEHENEGEPSVETEAPERANPLSGGALYVLALVGFFVAQREALGDLNWTAAGRTQADLVLDGDWWRCVTALCLHADVPHLAGNIFFGLVFGVFVCQLIGNGVGWLLIVLGGTLGNGLNALIQGSGHRSLGASTAVFAALGMLVACSFQQAHTQRRSRILRWAPLAAGLALFGLLGVEGENTDVFAHVTGILCGGLLGLTVARPAATGPLGATWQRISGGTVFALLIVSWVLAFAATA
jgi:membrane associated rhomboid family serine protease